MTNSEVITHDRGRLSGPELQAAADEILVELVQADELEQVAAELGLSSADLSDVRVEITESSSSIDPATAFILVHLAGGALSATGGGAVTLFWKKVVVPKIRARHGGDAIGEDRPEAQ